MRKLSFLLYGFILSVLLAPWLALGYVKSPQELDQTYPGEVSWLNEVFPGYDLLSYDWLKQTIETNNVSSIEQLLPLLPEGLRKSYTLVHSSAALQGADRQNPRAILFAPDARLVIAFNGAKSQERFQHLEVLDYTADNGAARLFDIDFSKSGQEKYSVANPATCMKCHSSYPKPNGEAKPIWPNYNKWFGSYGSEDDRLSNDEIDDYQVFTEKQSEHPRYKWLIRESDVHEHAPFHRASAKPTEDEYPSSSPKGHYYLDNGVSVNPRNPRFMPGLRLSKALDARNAKRIGLRILANETYQQLKYTTLFAMVCVPKNSRETFKNDPEYLPDGIPQMVLPDLGIDPNAYTILFSDDRADYHTGNGNLKTDSLVTYQIAKDVFSNESSYEDGNVARLFTPNYWRSYYALFSMSQKEEDKQTDTYKYLWAWGYLMDQVSPAFSTRSWGRIPKRHFGYSHPEAKTADLACAELGEQAIAEVAGREDQFPQLFEDRGRFKVSSYGMKSVSGRQYRDVPAILNQCADCHDPSEVNVNFAPYIPFANESALKMFIQSEQRGESNRFLRKIDRYLSKDEREAHLGGRRMPLGRRSLSDSERASFVTFLESLQ